MKTLSKPKSIPTSKKFNNIARLEILNQIMDCWQQVAQWDEWGYDTKASVVEYQHKAQVLIELLEVDDCGSVGGFDNSNKPKRETRNRVFNRFMAVLKKYHTASDLENGNGSVDSYIEFFGAPE